MARNFSQYYENDDISRHQYDEYILCITKLGFTPKQANSILLKKGALKTFKFLTQNFAEFKEFFSFEDMTLMASCNFGDLHLKIVLENRAALEAIGFTRFQIIGIATYESGVNNLMAIVKHQSTLKCLGYNVSQIYEMAACRWGEKNLNFVVDIAPQALHLFIKLPVIKNLVEQKAFAEHVKLLSRPPKSELQLLDKVVFYDFHNPLPKRPMLESRPCFFAPVEKTTVEISDEELFMMGMMGVDTEELYHPTGLSKS